MKSSASATDQRAFAIDVVRQLRAARHEALWAGGCVRDDLLGIQPDDFDVATSATPEQVIDLFGKRRTVAVGASFGVVMVLGPSRSAGQVEVATFRADGEYLDGRRPSGVTFCSAQEDALRRDFTINGMFFDPVSNEVIDYVNGQADLEAGILRAIGDARERFTEDKLRMLRAVRFASTYEFQLEESTAAAIGDLKSEICQVSAERIAQELRRMMAHATRAVSYRRLAEFDLLSVLFGFDHCVQRRAEIDTTLQSLRLPRFETAFAVLLSDLFRPEADSGRKRTADVVTACRKLKLANIETDCICWLVGNLPQCLVASELPLHILKPILSNQWIPLLLDLLQATERLLTGETPQFIGLQEFLATHSAESLAPPPFINGSDLQSLNVPRGPQYSRLLQLVRNLQLDEVVTDRNEALQQLQRFVEEHDGEHLS